MNNLSISKLYAKYWAIAKMLRDLGVLSFAADELSTRNLATFQTAQFEATFQKCIDVDSRLLLGSFENPLDKAFRWRLHILLQTAKASLSKDSVFLDLGCGSGMIAAALLYEYSSIMYQMNISYYMFDSFVGAHPNDRSTHSYRRDDLAQETALDLSYKYANIVKIHVGYLPDTLSHLSLEDIKRCRFISLDLNSAAPEIKTLELILQYLPSGCIIILDDFCNPGSIEQNTLHSAFCQNKSLPLLHLPTGQGMIIIP